MVIYCMLIEYQLYEHKHPTKFHNTWILKKNRVAEGAWIVTEVMKKPAQRVLAKYRILASIKNINNVAKKGTQ